MKVHGFVKLLDKGRAQFFLNRNMVLLLFPATFLVLFTVIFLCHGPCISVSEIILCVVVFS